MRMRTGLGIVAFGRAMGYTGSDATISRKLRRLEHSGSAHVPSPIARAAQFAATQEEHRHAAADQVQL